MFNNLQKTTTPLNRRKKLSTACWSCSFVAAIISFESYIDFLLSTIEDSQSKRFKACCYFFVVRWKRKSTSLLFFATFLLFTDWFSTCDARYPLTGKTISSLTWSRRRRLCNNSTHTYTRTLNEICYQFFYVSFFFLR